MRMRGNIQHPTSNIQHSRQRCGRRSLRCWTSNVECWALLFSSFIALPLCAQTPREQIPPLAAPYGQIPPTFWERQGAVIEQHRAVALVCGFLLAGTTAFGLWLWRRPKVRAVIPPEVIARQALTRWLDCPEDENCLNDVSQKMRRYVVAAFQLPAGELTAAEICQALAGNETGGAELAGALAEFLRECDRHRFAPVANQPPLNAAGRALDLVTMAERRRAARSAPIFSQA